MKKKYRRIIYNIVGFIIWIVALPILLMTLIGFIGGQVCDKLLTPMIEWIKTKLRVHDYDQD